MVYSESHFKYLVHRFPNCQDADQDYWGVFLFDYKRRPANIIESSFFSLCPSYSAIKCKNSLNIQPVIVSPPRCVANDKNLQTPKWIMCGFMHQVTATALTHHPRSLQGKLVCSVSVASHSSVHEHDCGGANTSQHALYYPDTIVFSSAYVSNQVPLMLISSSDIQTVR